MPPPLTGKDLAVVLTHIPPLQVVDFVTNSPALEPITTNHHFFPKLITTLLEPKILSRFGSRPQTPLSDFTTSEAEQSANALGKAVRNNHTAVGAVNLWRLQIPAMQALLSKYPILEPMLVDFMLHSLTTHGFWLALRVFKMSFVSILDLSSDVYIVIKYMNEPRTSGYGVSLLFCIVLCLMLQTLTTSLQMARKPGRIPLELCFIWMGVKPAVDSYRVAVGKEIEKWEAFDSKLVHTCTKMDEMIAESIPGCILQIYALFRVIEDGSPVSKAAVGSILVSAVTTGLASKNISWNFDDDPTCRANVPDFYGYLPSSDWKRTVMGACMVTNSTVLLLLRSFSAAMLMLVDKRYFALYTIADMAIYVAYKMARGDFAYWAPIYGWAGALVSVLMRFIVKIIADFTGVIQFRHPQELGGIYWTVNMVMALGSSAGSVWVYYAKGGMGIEQRIAWRIVGGLSALWLLSFGVFLALVKKEFVSTFFSLETASEFCMRHFTESEDDGLRADVFSTNTCNWKPIRPEVKAWVLANWLRWKREQPEWFTEHLIASVPLDMVPESGKEEVKGIKLERAIRRGSSMFQLQVSTIIYPTDSAKESYREVIVRAKK